MPFLPSSPFGRKIAVTALVLTSLQQVHAQEVADAIFRRYAAVASALEKANKEVEAHHFEEAKRLLEPVLAKVPDHVGAHFLLARMAYESHDPAGALSHIETSEGSLKDLGLRYAKLMEDMRARDEADARDIKQSLQNLKDAGYDSIDDILAAGQQRVDQLEDKKRGLFLQEASFAVPSVYSLLHGNCLYQLGRKPEAAAQYQLAVRSDPANGKAWNNLVAVCWETKNFEQARATLAKAEAAGAVIQPKLKQSVLEAK